MKTISLTGNVQINSNTSVMDQKGNSFAGGVSDNQKLKVPGVKNTLANFLIIVLTGFLSVTFCDTAMGQNTGLKSPTTSVVLGGTPVAANSLVLDNNYTSYAFNGDAAGFGGFGFGIPNGVSILGIEVQLTGNRATAGSNPPQFTRDLNISLSWDNGTTYTSAITMTRYTSGTDAVVSVGGSTNLWGRTWALSDFPDANFAVRCVVPASAYGTININLIQVRVYYQCNTTAPTVTSPVTYCQNTSAVALTANGSSLLWYTTPTGGTGVSSAPVPVTTTAGSTSYYVSQTVGCEGPRATINVIVHPTPISAVIGQTNITCNAKNDGTIMVSASNGTPPYLFTVDAWAHSQGATSGNTSLFTGLSPNIQYVVQVRDANNCYSK